VSEIRERKLAHLDLCLREDVEHRSATLLDDVQLFHEALPDLSLDEVDLSVELFGKHLRAPLVIAGMTGGAPRAGDINRGLAAVAQKAGLAMGLGSQRALWRDPELASTWRVRDVAPDVLLLANIGAVQARDAGPAAVQELVDAVGADALCVHCNVAQELVQDEGDRDFRGCLDAIALLADELPVPIVAKETGCGFAPATLARLRAAGVRCVDVSGAGGTSWTRVESLRGSRRQRELGETLRDWGIPTAAAVVFARRAGLDVLASGGIRDAQDVVRALALGASAACLALPFLRAFEAGGEKAASALAERLAEGVRALLLLIGARSSREACLAPRRIGPELRGWLEAEAPVRAYPMGGAS
jgi:isopentenyl-diphosphate delta-isomerase